MSIIISIFYYCNYILLLLHAREKIMQFNERNNNYREINIVNKADITVDDN